jgi:DNA-binding MurR/RpiR family transcriptional regulator
MEGIKQKVKPRKRWRDEGEEDLNKKGQSVARDCRELRKVLLEAKVHKEVQRLRRRRRNYYHNGPNSNVVHIHHVLVLVRTN